MKKASSWSNPSKFLFRNTLKYRRLLPNKKCRAFGALNSKEQPHIERIYVINLNRQVDRLTEMKHELSRLRDRSDSVLWNLTERYSAVDANDFLIDPVKDDDVDPYYTLGDQLFVEPQPLTLPSQIDLDSLIKMSRPEIAVAQSHIGVWRQVLAGTQENVLILEDDVWFRPGFAKNLEQAWTEISKKGNFDILYLSYEEVKHGAPKTFLSDTLFCPERGLWNLSGYVISRTGAKKMLRLLPCRGPIDLWINHQFQFLNVLAIKKSIISQRPDLNSTNSYSILPSLTKIGAINSESASLFHSVPSERPVFAFGPEGSGLTSLAMALSMLGYRCCNDLQTLPALESQKLFAGKDGRVFDAYVNIMSLASEIRTIKDRYPQAKFILTTSKSSIKDDNDLKIIIDELDGADIAFIDIEAQNKWKIVCKHLKCVPPAWVFPKLADLGQRRLLDRATEHYKALNSEIPKRDKSPWVVGTHQSWEGIHCIPLELKQTTVTPAKFTDSLKSIESRYWFPRSDTFTDNLALFQPPNIELLPGGGATLNIKKECLGAREYSAASLTTRAEYLYGRFEATFKVAKVPGVITGFFLHRNSPRQEIDIEIAGNRTDRLLVNVFYNPGSEGAKFDYGYRGAATSIELGFDASESYHQYAIEWDPFEIRWYVDNHLVHRRVDWDPTPIPHLAMSLHMNIWPCRSKELAGRLNNRRLPTSTFIKSIEVDANLYQTPTSL
jgi:GR25 family glycosyltransferase involved in LPS biosynthesis